MCSIRPYERRSRLGGQFANSVRVVRIVNSSPNREELCLLIASIKVVTSRSTLSPDPGGVEPYGFRRYRPNDIARLKFIRRARHLGFTLDEVRGLALLERGICPGSIICCPGLPYAS